MIDFVKYLLTMPFIISLIAVINNFVKYNSQSDFDKIFLPKHKVFWNESINTILIPLIITPLIIILSILFKTDNENTGNIIFNLAMLIYTLTLLLMFLRSDYCEPNAKLNLPKIVIFIRHLRIGLPSLLFINIGSIILSISIQLSDSSYGVFINNNDVNKYTTFIGYFIAIYLGVFIYSLFYYIVFSAFRNKKTFLIKNNHFKKGNLYVLYSLDKNTLVLGDEKLYKYCNSLYLYDLHEKTYSEFKTEN